MCTANRCKGCIIVYKVFVFCLVCPVDGIDRIRFVVTVLHTLLVTVKFLSVEDERNTLRCIHCCLCKFHHLQAFSLRSLCSDLKTVTKTVVIMTACITYMLKRIVCPCRNTYLRMLHTSCNTELQVCLLSLDRIHEACVLASERAADCITDIVAECSYLVQPVCIYLERD